MPKEAVSVTLDADNLLWLRGRTKAAGRRSLSETLDRLIADARASGRGQEAGTRSVVGTIDIDESDPLLLDADSIVRAQFDASTSRPLLGRETKRSWGAPRKKTRKARSRRA